jgi:peptidyl-prolyl cis-trans isomerase A (cyclophilin A)
MFKNIILIALVALLSACGGGGNADFAPVVTQIKASSLRYGQTASIDVAGQFMRNDMIVETPACTNPSFSANTIPEHAVLNCKISATGTSAITIKSATGAVLFTGTLTVLQPQVTLLTSMGNIVMELNPQATPVTVNNFLSYVSSGFYQGLLFHRVIAGFVVQGGGYTTGLNKKAGQAAIVLETNKGLINIRGTVAMARTNVPDSATSEFYFNLVDNPALDYQSAATPGYAVFGTVVKGMDVVDTIAATPTGVFNGTADVPSSDVTISFALQTQ